MKKNIIPVSIMLISIYMVACKKDSPSSQSSLQATKTDKVKKGEPVSFTMNNVANGSLVSWSVNPSENVQINASGNKASIQFGKAGSYSVLAISGNVSATSSVNVSDTAYSGGSSGGTSDRYTTAPLTGDELELTPTRLDSGATSGMIINVVSKNSYNCLNNMLLTDVTNTGADYAVSFSGVRIPGSADCNGGQAKASGWIYLYPLSEGNHVFKVTLNGTTYTGSFTKTGNKYAFSWTYKNGVTISPLTL